MSTRELIEEAKTKSGIESDYAFAKRLGVTGQLVSNWRAGRSKPDGINMLRIADEFQIEPKRAIELMEAGFGSVLVLFCIAFLSTMSLLVVTTPNALLGLQAFTGLASDLVYIMRSKVITHFRI